jgi:hypothetical protein
VKGSLDGPNAKLQRAKADMEALRMSIEASYPRNRRWPVKTQVFRKGLEYHFSIDHSHLPPVNPDWALQAGEVMFNLRSSLDHLQYQLWYQHFRGNVPPEIEFYSMFPILSTPKSFNRKRSEITNACNKLGKRSLSKRDWIALEFLQPYVKRNDQLHWDRNYLDRLNSLHNFDKHRKLHIVSAAQNASLIPSGFEEYGLRTIPSWGTVNESGVVEVWKFTRLPERAPTHLGVLLSISLEHDSAWAELTIFLPSLIRTVERVLIRFSNRFP